MCRKTFRSVGATRDRQPEPPSWPLPRCRLAAAWNLSQAHGPSIVAFLAIIIIGVLPRIAAGAGGLATAEYRLRNAGRVPAAVEYSASYADTTPQRVEPCSGAERRGLARPGRFGQRLT